MEHIPTYIRRHHGLEPVSYSEFPHAEKYLKPILDETYGIPVYQEQIMQIASAVAGYSWARRTSSGGVWRREVWSWMRLRVRGCP